MKVLKSIAKKCSWKCKAILRACRVNAVKKRIKELTESRDNWKEQAMKYKEANAILKKRASDLEKELKKNP